MTPSNFTDIIEHLRSHLQQELPGEAAQGLMAPIHPGRISVEEARRLPCRDAAVLVLLFPLANEPALVLTARPSYLTDHPGQISFPGGRREAGERLVETALREAEEEIGLDRNEVEVLGALSPLFIPPSRFCVYPYVAAASTEPTLRTSEEVESILFVPVSTLLEEGAIRHEQRRVGSRVVDVPFFPVEGYQVWGATAMMLSELLVLFRLIGH